MEHMAGTVIGLAALFIGISFIPIVVVGIIDYLEYRKNKKNKTDRSDGTF